MIESARFAPGDIVRHVGSYYQDHNATVQSVAPALDADYDQVTIAYYWHGERRTATLSAWRLCLVGAA